MSTDIRPPSTVVIDGTVSPGFEPVLAAFADNAVLRGDTSASCAVYLDGELVVDLWTGTATGYTADSRPCVFSVSKGVTALCLLMAVEDGHLELDAPVVHYWPEYAAAGKEHTTVRQVLAHRAGLPWPEHDLTVTHLSQWHPVAAALAAQAPAWEPGTAFAYHPLTIGWLAGEILRRATGERPSQWLQARIAEPLHVDVTYGRPSGDQTYRPMTDPLPILDMEAAAAMQQQALNPDLVRALSLGGVLDPADLFGSVNRDDLMACELPAANLVSSARSLARLYAAASGEVDGIRLLSPATLWDAMRVQSEGQPFLGLDEGNRWGTGFMITSPRRPMSGHGSFGHDGAGGHLAFGNLDQGLGFGYVTGRPGGIPDDRANSLCAALRTCLGLPAQDTA